MVVATLILLAALAGCGNATSSGKSAIPGEAALTTTGEVEKEVD